ncbi:MAG: sugar phosphate isomerase/epimerase family protein [Pirellulaceae bacterium]
MRETRPPDRPLASLDRRHFLAAGAASVAGAATLGTTQNLRANADEPSGGSRVVTPPPGKRILLSCKLGMIPATPADESLASRLARAAEAGFDGVDLDEAGKFTPEQARAAVQESGVFVHNAINHAHWEKTLTSPDEAVRAAGRANIEHCLRVSHAAGGSGVLIVVGKAADGTADVVVDRCRQEIQQLIPVAASLGQMILIENVWNHMFYDHDAPPEQTATQFVQFIDSFNSPWVGMYYDIGNHWKYGQPGEWIRELGRRCVKLDVKGYSRAKNGWTEITEGDLPWEQVRKALDEIGFAGWATAEVGGGDVKRLTQVREQMQKAFGI